MLAIYTETCMQPLEVYPSESTEYVNIIIAEYYRSGL
jgi:hypothetical protein